MMKMLTQAEVLDYHTRIEALLEELFDDPDCDIEIAAEDIFRLRRNGHVQIFYDPIEHSVCVTEIIQSPRKCWVNIIALIGGSCGFLAMWEDFTKWALLVGAVEIRGFMKEPQMRLAKRYGFKELYAVGRYDLRSKLC